MTKRLPIPTAITGVLPAAAPSGFRGAPPSRVTRPVPSVCQASPRSAARHSEKKRNLEKYCALTGVGIGKTPTKTLLMAGVVALALTIFTSPVHADPGGGPAALTRPFAQAGGPFIGDWTAHGEKVTVTADGTGVETSRYGTTNFMLDFVETSNHPWDTASGNVTGGSLDRGAFVTIMLVDGGSGMTFSAGGGDNNVPFCKIVNGNTVNSADCGA
jgi:hypothetical protein